MTFTLRDRMIVFVLAFLLGIYGAYKLIWVPTELKIEQLEEKKTSVEGLAGDITPLIEKSEQLKKEEMKLKESVENIKLLSGGRTTTNEEFLVFLGNSSKENNVDVTGFNDLGTTNNGGIYKAVFDFELKGKSTDINKVLEDMSNIGIKCSVGSVSYRQNEQFDYLKRFFDNISELPWYKEPEETEKEEKPDIDGAESNSNEFPAESVAPVTPDISRPEPTPEKQIPTPKPTPAPSPSQNPLPSPTQPVETPKKPETLEDRLNDLLEDTAAVETPYKIVYLTDTQQNGVTYKEGQDMRLAVTVCFIMFQEPSMSTSFLSQVESDANGIL